MVGNTRTFSAKLSLALAFFIVPFAALNATPALAQTRIVELEVYSSSRGAAGTQQRWMEMLQDVGADRVVVKTGTVEPAVDEIQLSKSTVIIVSGLVEREKLKLPGGSFSIRDKAGIRALIKRLKDDGSKVALAEKKAFGLTSEQLIDVHVNLSKPLDFDTRGVGAGEVVEKIGRLIGKRFSFDESARVALGRGEGGEAVADELNGTSAGTALAVVVRPLGLVFKPSREQGKAIKLMIVDSRGAEENWPIGWPPGAPPIRVEPKLFETLPLEVRGFPLGDVLNAIQKRSGVPFFYDHNSFARQGVELSEMKVTLVKDKVSYKAAISRLISQNKPKLKDELRIDENGKPFLWISVR